MKRMPGESPPGSPHERETFHTLREQLVEHLRRVEAGLFRQMETNFLECAAPNPSLARELRQYIHDVLESLDRVEAEERESEPLELTLEQMRRIYAAAQQRESERGR